MDRKPEQRPNMEEMIAQLRGSRFESWRVMRQQLLDEGWTRWMLWESDAPNWKPEVTDQDPPSLYLMQPILPGKGLFIVCAGGGFMFKSYNEAKPVAEYFHARGINAAVLDYRVGPYTQLDSCADGLRAVRLVRSRAAELGIPADKIAIGGFSAGGMLTGMVSTRFDYGNPDAADPVERVSSRPDAALVLYGAFTGLGAPQGGLGFDNAKQNEAARMNNVKNLRWDCPPFFLFQTHKDDPSLAMRWGLECAERGIEFEVHTFHEGSHGQGLYDGKNEVEDVPHTAHWAELAAEWLHDYGF